MAEQRGHGVCSWWAQGSGERETDRGLCLPSYDPGQRQGLVTGAGKGKSVTPLLPSSGCTPLQPFPRLFWLDSDPWGLSYVCLEADFPLMLPWPRGPRGGAWVCKSLQW